MKPICVKCHRFFKPKKNGFYFLEGRPLVNDAKPGLKDIAKWGPYKLWSGDLWECLGCGATIISGTGRERIAEHYEQNFGEQVETLGASQFQVNDC